MAAQTPVIAVEDLTKHFGGLKALEKVNVMCDQAEILGIIGPNGAGKTTLFNLITGFITPTAGRVFLFGDDITGHSASDIVRAGIARTFQGIRLFKRMTVREHVWLAQSHFAKNWIWTWGGRDAERELKKEADEILSMFRLHHKADQVAGNLPFGDMRRLEICRALATRPKVLLLDEPASGLTPVETQQLIDDLAKLPKKGISLLLIEHDMNVALGLSHRVCVLNFGQVLCIGPPQEIQRHPECMKAYLGEQAVEASGAHSA